RLTTEKIVNAGVTMVPEGRRLFPRLTVEENLITGAHLARCRNNSEEKISEMYDMFPRLAERHNQVVNQMSGGEQQMVAIARALMSDPQVVLFDELSLGLAPAIVDDIYEKVNQINESGVTCIVIEQDMKRALRVSNHVLVLLEGAVVLEGDPKELDGEQVMAAYFGSDIGGASA
ncbi:MAG: ATP-binding cassette domain-containing protein, partial [Rhodospirillales bacterium]|nr:ATP-binding cassette domain-containing protein [Rhodospirillales bacterium]